MINYKQLLVDLGLIAYNHPQINSFGFGDLKQCTNDIETKQEPRYTRMYVVPDMVEFSENRINYSFNIIVMDKVEEDLSNLTDVLSDTNEIMKDIYTILYLSYTEQQGNFSWYIVPDGVPQITPFTERFETILGGWTMNIKFQVPFDYNSCVVPIQFGFGFPEDQTFESYRVVIEDFKKFADLHDQINSFGFGDITQLTNDVITKQEPKYIRMYIIPGLMRFEPNHVHIGFDVIICDKLEEDIRNQEDALNDCLEICKDFFAKLYLSEYEADWNATVEPFLERSETILAGWLMRFNIIQKFDYNRCVLPERNFARGITWEEVLALWKNEYERWSNI
jgi:hypothetical protein